MVKRRGDQTPEPPGGRAIERLKLFELSRGIVPSTSSPSTKTKTSTPGKTRPKSGEANRAKQPGPKVRPKR